MSSSTYVSRVNQVDAVQLDHEIYNVLKTQSKEITKICLPGKVEQWEPEINVLIKIAIWYFSLRKDRSTFGQQLLNLRYTDFTQRKAILYLVLSTVPKYLQERLADARLVTTSTRERIKYCIEYVANVIDVIELLNLLLFLHRGTRPRTIEHVLRISSQSTTAHKPRNIGYTYMTRELLWHGLMELFSISLPMINFPRIMQALYRFWAKRKGIANQNVHPRMNLATKCPQCNETPILPCHAGCEHIFCYYCLNAFFTATERFLCPGCDVELHAANMTVYIHN
ncbi:peroxisome biogenesis factor 2 [Orussus abietinus]|uniref:peroxisome biogenesis factor 2 n=1 Tax=Orussus abietinus TaxID=222816 RepID=UPI00062682BC|nr:peroxisome biogenesis factor 2 [Orussus abietinus]